jgi:hypothetical protein
MLLPFELILLLLLVLISMKNVEKLIPNTTQQIMDKNNGAQFFLVSRILIK